MSRREAWLAVAVALFSPMGAAGHEVLHRIDRNQAIAVKAYFADGEALAYTQYEIYSPADPKVPHQKGRTDRSGWLSFVPDTAGKWRIKIIDDAGHGIDLMVDATSAGTSTQGPQGGAAFVLRPLVGLAVVAAVFAILVARYRRKRTPP